MGTADADIKDSSVGNLKVPSFKLGVGRDQYPDLHAPPAARNSAVLIYSFTVHSASFSPQSS